MDLKNLDTISGSNQGFELQLRNPANGEELSLFITILGRDSDAFRRLQTEQSRRRLNKLMRAGSTGKDDDFESDSVRLLAACTKAWRDGDNTFLTIGGENLACSRENAIRLYTEYPWIKDQVDAAILDRANFTPR